MLVNPLVDGMNLVAKEAAVVSRRDAVIVLSETAGAFDQMADGVLPGRPADIVGTADALAARPRRCRSPSAANASGVRAGVEREEITWWLRRQLEDLWQSSDSLSAASRSAVPGRPRVDVRRLAHLGRTLVVGPAHADDRRLRATELASGPRWREHVEVGESSPATSTPRRQCRSTIARAGAPLVAPPRGLSSTIIRPSRISTP